MASASLSQGTPSPHPDHYSIKEFQLLVRDTPVVPAEIQPFVGIQYTSSNQVYSAFQHLTGMPVETFLVLHLDNKNRMVGMTTCSIGSMTASLVHPRDVFRPAIANLTAGLVLIHNHPSGHPQPSQEDIQIIKRLYEVGNLIGISVLDHVVIGGQGRYFSFADQGMLACLITMDRSSRVSGSLPIRAMATRPKVLNSLGSRDIALHRGPRHRSERPGRSPGNARC